MKASYLDILLIAIFFITIIAASFKKFDKKELLSDFLFGVRVIFAYIGAFITYYIIQTNSLADKGIARLVSYVDTYIISPSFTAYILTVAIYAISIIIIYIILNIFLGMFRRVYLINKVNKIESKKIIKRRKKSGFDGMIFNIPTAISYCLIVASIFVLLSVKGILPIKGESAFVSHALEGFESVKVNNSNNPFNDFEFTKGDDLISANSKTGTHEDEENVIVYYNGVTLDQAITSNSAIDAKAKELVSGDTDAIEKSRALYNWVGSNITYDDAKAEEITVDKGKGVKSGAIEAFDTRTGVCFDYASLYTAMAREVGLKVRMVSGEGYTGTSWGPHAWNEVYIPSEKKWIPVDTTFASSGDYFATADFYDTHRDGKIIGQW